jgi:hypothetical protein
VIHEQAEADAVLLGRVTQHWFRHMLATRLLRKDPRAAMEQGGWLDIRSVIGYAQDVPEHRRQLVVDMDEVARRLVTLFEVVPDSGRRRPSVRPARR